MLIEETSEIHLNKPNLRSARGAACAGAARPGGAAAARHDCRPAARDAAASARSHPGGRGPWRGGVRPAAGAEHRPPRQPEHHPRELRRAGAHASGALRPDGERRPAAPQHPRGHRAWRFTSSCTSRESADTGASPRSRRCAVTTRRRDRFLLESRLLDHPAPEGALP